jgi:urease accessory protein UreF
MSVGPSSPQFRRHELGLYLPPSVEREAVSTSLPYVGTYLTYNELTGRAPIPEEEIIGRLEKMSAADCLLALAQLGARLFAGGSRGIDGQLQHELVDHVVGDGPLGEVLHEKLRDPRWTAIFCEQQLVHLARLVILNADRRPPDDFNQQSLYAEWVTCLIGVTDLLDADLQIGDRNARLAWEIRQCQLNHHEEQLPATAIHHELYTVLWPEVHPENAAAVEKAFQSATRMSIGDYFMVGSAVMARLVNFGHSGEGAPMLRPDVYFSSTRIDPSIPQAFFAFNARDVDDLRAELQAEERQYGRTTYGSLTFERFPLVEAQPGFFLPASVASLHRRITEGVFHILAEEAEAEGHDRRHYVSPFGDVFQVLVEKTVRRAEAVMAPSAPITADVEYGKRNNRRRSSDVIVAYDRNPLFIEAVSGPLQAATTTRGEVQTFRADLERLIIGKARQLDRCVDDFLAGALEVPGAEPATTDKVWPVVLTSHSFPHAETVMEVVREALQAEDLLQQAQVGELAIVSAEDLFFCEGHMEQGRSLLRLIRSWKSGAGAHLPFKNELISIGGGRAPGSSHFERRFAEASSSYINMLLGKSISAEQVLERARDTHGST